MPNFIDHLAKYFLQFLDFQQEILDTIIFLEFVGLLQVLGEHNLVNFHIRTSNRSGNNTFRVAKLTASATLNPQLKPFVVGPVIYEPELALW